MSGKEDWAKGSKRKHIEVDRQFMWREDTIALIARWVGLRPGMTVVDVGCGLGYLGWTYWEFLAPGGTYLGLDISADLLDQAVKKFTGWARRGHARFGLADAYHLPLPDGAVDCTMCQTLLMHLARPLEGLAEMMRITKPGGTVMCKEPDHLSCLSRGSYSSIPPPSLRERMREARAMSTYVEGHRRLGRGDATIGTKVPRMMAELGLVRIDARLNDQAFLVQPPYETPYQRFLVERARERLGDSSGMEEWEREFKECFLAGGGSRSTCYRFLYYVRRRRDKVARLLATQVQDGRYFACAGQGAAFLCVKGTKA